MRTVPRLSRRFALHTAVASMSSAPATPIKPAPPPTFHPLGLPPHELTLAFTLPTGQSFRWRPAGDGSYFGVISGRLLHVRDGSGGAEWRVVARAPSAPPATTDAATLADYFQTSICLADREAQWAAADPKRYASVAGAVRGVRVLRQDPLETLISFILSSNNNITRIASLVERVAALYGDQILAPGELRQAAGVSVCPPPRSGALPHVDDAWHAFPTLAQLASADEPALRAAGLGYRARYVVGTASALASTDGGGDAWLHALRTTASTRDAVTALATLPGVGPKVAACVALFSLDKRDCVPVDTHVWQLAARHYTPSLRGKSFTPALAERVVEALTAVFGEEAGWAHNALFVAELPSTRAALAAAGVKVEAAEGGGVTENDESDTSSSSSSEGEEAWGPVTPAERAKRRRRV